MNEQLRGLPQHLVKRVQEMGQIQARFDESNLINLFRRQAELDQSGDLPFLRGLWAFVAGAKFVLAANYTIDEDKKDLFIAGVGVNNEQGELEDKEEMLVQPAELRARVVEGFGGELTLPNFIRGILEEVLTGVKVGKLFIDGDGLGVVLEQKV